MIDEVWVYHNPEPDIWYVMVVSLPTSKSEPDRKEDAATPVMGALNPDVLHSVLQHMHESYTLFYGPLRNTIHPDGKTIETDNIAKTRKRLRKAVKIRDGLEREDILDTPERQLKAKEIPVLKERLSKMVATSRVAKLRSKLRATLTGYLRSVSFDRLHVFESLRGFHYLPVDRITFLSTQYFINLLRTRFQDSVISVSFLFDGRIMSTDMSVPLMRVVYNAIRREPLLGTIDKSRRMSLPFVLAPNGSVFSRPIYDVGSDSNATMEDARKRRPRTYRVGSVDHRVDLSNITDVSQESTDVLLELNKLSSQSLLSWKESGDGKDDDKSSNDEDDDDDDDRSSATTTNRNDRNTNDPVGRMLIFQEGRVMLLLVVKTDALPTAPQSDSTLPPLCANFVEQMKPEVRKLGKVIAEQYDRMQRAENTKTGQKPKYVYFNRMNLALKTEGIEDDASSSSSRKRSKSTASVTSRVNVPSDSSALTRAFSTDVLRELDETYTCMTRSDQSGARETYTKLRSRDWVAARASSGREFYVFLDKSVGDLKGASKAMEGLRRRTFYNISS